MKTSAYGQPIHIKNGETTSITKNNEFSELEIQNMIFAHPECLPISDIDESFNPVIPVCTELQTGAGPLDIFMISPNGDLVIIETKLWKNPQARREVIAQILDYAKEVAAWTYEDLQREVNKKLKTRGNALYNIAAEAKPDLVLNESDFVDAVSRNLRLGNFLLLIAGDGMREGAKSISEFLNRAGNLNFTFAMVELSIYSISDTEKIILPRTIVKTVEIQRINIEVPEGFTISTSAQETEKEESSLSPEQEQIKGYRTNFWNEFISELELDDPGQAMPQPTVGHNIFLYPSDSKYCWVSAYFAASLGIVGVYFRIHNSTFGRDIKEKLTPHLEDLIEELGGEVESIWEKETKSGFYISRPFNDVYAPENREEIKTFFSHWINEFVNVVRPRLKE